MEAQPNHNNPEANNQPDPNRTARMIAAFEEQFSTDVLNAAEFEEIKEWCRNKPVYFLYPKNEFFVLCSRKDNAEADNRGDRIMGLKWHLFVDVLLSQFPETSAWLKKKEGEESLVPVVRAAIIRQKSVDAVGVIAGYRRGLHTLPSGKRFLALESQKYVEPVPGDCRPVLDLVDAVFGEDRKAKMALLSWIKIALTDLIFSVESCPWDYRIRPRQALIIIGPPGAGKTLLAALLQRLFGGTKADPSSYFASDTNFNSDMAAATLLVMDDNMESRNPATRRRLGQAIKQFLVVPEKRFHAKYMEASSTPSFHALMILGNEEALETLPIIDDSMKDKVILLKAQSSELVSRMHTLDGKADWVKSMVDALPAFAHYLLSEFEIPDDMCDPRFGLAAFANEQLLCDINGDESLADLYDIVMESLRRDLAHPEGINRPRGNGTSGSLLGKIDVSKKIWRGNASDFERYVKAVGEDKLNISYLFRYNSLVGDYLKHFANKYGTVRRTGMSQGRTRWEIQIVDREPPATPEAED